MTALPSFGPTATSRRWADVVAGPPAALAAPAALSGMRERIPTSSSAPNAFAVAETMRLAPPAPARSTRAVTPASFEALLQLGVASQAPSLQSSWAAALRALCSQGCDPRPDNRLRLLSRLLDAAPQAQAPLARYARTFVDANSRLDQILAHVDRLHGAIEARGLAAVDQLMDALAHVQCKVWRRRLLRTLLLDVPAAHLAWFLRAAECLLASGHRADARRVVAAARSCTLPVAPRNITEAQYDALYGVGKKDKPARQWQSYAADDMRLFAEAMQGADLADCTGTANQGAGVRSQDPYWHAARENVQHASRIDAVKVAWAHLSDKYPRVLPTQALFRLADAAYEQQLRAYRSGRGPLGRDVSRVLERAFEDDAPSRVALSKSPQLAWPRRVEAAEALVNVWAGQGLHYMTAIRQGRYLSTYLDEWMVHTRSFIGILWLIMHADRPQGGEGEAHQRHQRELLRHGFWNALVENNDFALNWYDGGVRLRRLCPIGLTQRLLSRLQGYEDVRFDTVTPQEFLAALAQKFAEPFARGESASAAEVGRFYLDAVHAAAQRFRGRDQEQFEQELRDYLLLDYEEVAAEALALAVSRSEQG